MLKNGVSTNRRPSIDNRAALWDRTRIRCLPVGNTMRPITDRLRISREKLAYLVDSTAAPVAALIPVSTWVGYQVSLVGDTVGPVAGSVRFDDQSLSFVATGGPLPADTYTLKLRSAANGFRDTEVDDVKFEPRGLDLRKIKNVVDNSKQ